MTSVLVTALICGTVAWVVSRAESVLRDLYLKPPATPAATDVAPMPDDLLKLAMGHDQEWARQQTLEAMQERYRISGDWNAVRTAFDLVEG